MRTLIYCTAYAQTHLLWQRRYRRWVDAVQAGQLGQSQIVLVDDGSPVLPGWPDTDVVTVRSVDEVDAVRSAAPVVLLRYGDRLGRSDIYDFPGWYRSFASGARYAVANGFEKVLHLESDAYILSERMRGWVRETKSGWLSPWSTKYDFPEIAIQLIGPDQLASLDAFTRRPYAGLVGVTHETALPLTYVARELAGDRLGEGEGPVPEGVDFATQVPAQREPAYYWWLNGAASPQTYDAEPVHFEFGRDRAGVELLGDGWARPEPKGSWMIHALSVIKLPELPKGGVLDMTMIAVPHVQRQGLPLQRVFVQANAAIVAEFDFHNTFRVGCEIPAEALRRDGTDRLRFLHPDAAPPARFRGEDKRILSVMLCELTLRRRGSALP